MYQDEGGRSDFDEKNVFEKSQVAGTSSPAEPSAARQGTAGPVKTGKLGTVNYSILYIVA